MDLDIRSRDLEGVENPELNESQKALLKQALRGNDVAIKNPPFSSVLDPFFLGDEPSTSINQHFDDQILPKNEESSGPRSKTSLRMHYEAQVNVIKNQVGTLEELRLKLGLSQRKISQLLMIDPSSWTRWTKKGDEAPPHIWRALQWYSIIQEKIPGLTPQYFAGNSPQVLHAESLRQIETERTVRQMELAKMHDLLASEVKQKVMLENDIKTLKKDLKFHRNISILVLSISLLWAGLFLSWNYL